MSFCSVGGQHDLNATKNHFRHDVVRGNDDDGCACDRHIFNGTRYTIRAAAIQSHITGTVYALCDSNNILFESHEITTHTQERYSIMFQIEITARNDTAEFSV